MAHHLLAVRPRLPRRAATAGFALLEALVAILLVAVGVLGLVGLQAKMTHAQTASKFGGDATYLATELIGTMWVDTPNLASYATTSAAPCSYARCSDWLAKVATALPKGKASVTVAAGVVTIAVSWTVPSDGLHTYSTTTAVTAAGQ